MTTIDDARASRTSKLSLVVDEQPTQLHILTVTD